MRQLPDNLTPRRYFVKHRTSYEYSEPVTLCHERGFLTPRATDSQTVVVHGSRILPEPLLHTEHTDRFGNTSHYVEIHYPHTMLEVVKEAVIDVEWPEYNVDQLDEWTLASARRAIAGNPAFRLDRAMYGLPSKHVAIPDELSAYIDSLLAPSLGFGQALVELTKGIRRDFAYRPGVTSIRTTVAELLELRAGVCQDFAHLGIAILRSLGIPARYVSGYIETTPPPGKPRLEGSDASHAWISVLAPSGQWIDIDPTNSQFADSRYLVTAWGRDFADVSPLRGVVVTEAASSRLSVGVDVVAMDGDEVPQLSVLKLNLSS
ncbi:MAG TPA: transglutaminase family protein [Tessaracoccus flavescens]|uniref:Transglutaminase family protein n=1 Tax=Tessaracoccus flavescens TaxID=399497 RepID=A0A921ENG0_9ACTN|nr:transglutaminase family protein [Tessaracoccus flavescens]